MGQLVGLEFFYPFLGEVPPEPVGAFGVFALVRGARKDTNYVVVVPPLTEAFPRRGLTLPQGA